MEETNSLDDLVSLLDNLFQDRKLWVCLKTYDESNDGSKTHNREYVLAQFSGTYDMCDQVIGEYGEAIALEFLFVTDSTNNPSQESPLISIPIDPDDTEVNLLEHSVEIDSMGFSLSLHMV